MLLMTAEYPAFLTPRPVSPRDPRATAGSSSRRVPWTPLPWSLTALGVMTLLFIPCPGAAEANLDASPDDPRWHQELRSLRGSVPDDGFLLAHGAVIGEIYVQTDDIFDPKRDGEDGFLHRLANRLHINTRPSVVERQLFFRKGDPYNPRVLLETARHLRSLDYIFDAWIEPIRYQHNRVDLLVTTRDVWTLGMGAGFKRSGGANTFNASLEESNLLGTGRFLDIKYADDPDRSSYRFRYVDLGLFDSRTELRLWYADNSDGHRQVFDLSHPFYSLDTRWAAATKVISDERNERIFSQGVEVDRFAHRTTFAEIRGGLSKGFHDGRTRRWTFGYTYERDSFGTPLFVPGDGFPNPSAPSPNSDPDVHRPAPIPQPSTGLPADRQLSYFWVGIEQIADRYVTLRNMDQLNRTEDFNLGLELSARVGWSNPSWGGDESQAIFDANLRSGWSLADGQNLFVSGYANGRWGSSGHENVMVGGEIRYYFKNFGRHRLHATIRADAAWNMDPENQLLLGGDRGLRGYPRNYQDGDRRLLVSLEQRFFTNWELFKLVNVGAAVFFDAGQAWYEDNDQGQGFLKDVGLGLRLSSSRSSRGQMVHLDLAFPLDGDADEMQWLVTTHRSF